MPKLIVRIDDFDIASNYYCRKTFTETTTGETTSNIAIRGPVASKITKSFAYSLPNWSEIKKATLHAEIGAPGNDVWTSKINGINTSASVDVQVNELSGTIEIPFVYMRDSGETHDHGFSGTVVGDSTDAYGTATRIYEVGHTSVLKYTNVYLEIEYTCSAYLYHAENDVLVPYQLYHAENGALVLYRFFCKPGDKLYTADGEQLYTADGYTVRVLGE